jgi:prophage regulatory protein
MATSFTDQSSMLPTTILRRKQVIAKTGLARSTIYDHMRRGTFPKPIRLGDKIVGWIESEVNAWLNDQITKCRQGNSL